MLHTLKDLDWTEFDFPVIAVYENPSDYPGKFVARVFDLNKATTLCLVKDTLEEIRNELPIGMKRLSRSKEDDPVITETWI